MGCETLPQRHGAVQQDLRVCDDAGLAVVGRRVLVAFCKAATRTLDIGPDRHTAPHRPGRIAGASGLEV